MFESLKGKRVLVTGGDGFIGSHLTERLVANGCQVRSLAIYNSSNSWGWLDTIPRLSDVEVVTGDIRDPNFCRVLTKDTDIVFNLAALIAIPYSYVAPDSYVATNISGTVNMLQAARDNGCSHFIQTSTSEVYGTALSVPINEDHPLQPQSPYSATKIGSDALAMSFYNAFEFPVTIARPFNTYGPRQSARAVIPTIITQIANGTRTIKLGDIRPTRDFNFVTDTCDGMLAIASHPDKTCGEAINIGSGEEISIENTVKLIADIMRTDIQIDSDPERWRPERSEVERLLCDASKMKTLTGYTNPTSLRDGFQKTIDWFTKTENLSRYKADIYNV